MIFAKYLERKGKLISGKGRPYFPMRMIKEHRRTTNNPSLYMPDQLHNKGDL